MSDSVGHNIPDRSGILTEQRHPRSMHLHRCTAAECIALIQEEDVTVAAAVAAARSSIVDFVSRAESGFLRGGRLIYFGAGTSGRLGVLDASEAPPTFQVAPDRIIGIIAGGDASLRRSSEGMEDDPEGAVAEFLRLDLSADDAVLGIATGGTTPYVLGGLAWLKQQRLGCLTGLLCCTAPPPETQADVVICVETGPEVLTGSTRMKAGTATKMVLNTISTTLMVRSGRVYENLMVDLRASNDKLRDRGARIVSVLTGLSRTDAFALLNRAGGEVKTAVVMARLGITAADARARLADAGGRLDRLIDG